MKKIGYNVSKYYKLILIVATVLLFPSVIGIKMTSINYDMLDYLPDTLDSTKAQSILDEVFHNAATCMLIVDDPSDREVLEIKDEVSQIDGVSQVIWRDDIFDVMIPDDMMPDDLKDLFYSDSTTMLFIKLEESASSDKTQKVVDQIRDISKDKAYLTGTPPLVKDTKDLIDRETPIYVGLAVLFSVIVLLFCTESFVIPFLFLISIGYAVIYNMGTNIIFGEISYITKAIAAVLQLAVTMDYSIFLYHRYEEERLKYPDDHTTAMGIAIDSTIVSIVGSSLTTVAGFLALVVMELTIGKDIGLVMVKGVIFGLISAVTVLPALILALDKLIHRFQHRVLLPSFEKTSKFVVKNYKILLVIFVLLFIPGIYGNNNVEVYYDLSRSLPKEMPSMVSLTKLKDEYEMASTHFLILKDDISPIQSKQLQEDIGELDGIKNISSVDSFVGSRIPISFLPEMLTDNFAKEDYRTFIISSEYKSATPEMTEQISKINKLAKDVDDNASLTGEAVLIEDMTKIADRDFQRVNVLSIAVVFVIVLFVFKSISIPVILIMAIELAIFLNFSFVYFTNTVIPFVASIIIGTIQLGSTIDYSILLFTRYIEELKLNPNKYEAMKRTIKETARSIVTSALSFFAATIGVGLYSQMEIVSSMCIMMARGAFLSMLVILLLLPSVILFCNKLIVATTKELRPLRNK